MVKRPRDEMPEGPAADAARPAVTIDLPASAIGEIREPDAKPAEAARTPEAEPATAPKLEAELLPEPATVPEPAMMPPPPAARAPTPKVVPALFGLVAGALGGFGAWHAAEGLNPRPVPAVSQPQGLAPSALAALETRLKGIEDAAKSPATAAPAEIAERLAKAEAALAESLRREAAARGEAEQRFAAQQTALEQGVARQKAEFDRQLAAESAARKQAFAELGNRPAAPLPLAGPAVPAADGEARAELEGLKARLGQIEAGARALPEAIGQASAKGEAAASRIEGIAPKVEAVAGRIEALAPKVEQVGGEVAALGKSLASRESLLRASSALSATTLLEEAFARGEPLSAPLGVLASLGIAPASLAAFQPFAERGAPNAAVLLAELRAIQPKAPAEAKPSGDFVDRLKAGALSLVEIRQTGEITGTDDAAHLARAEQALGRGDIATALALVGRLSAQRGEAYGAWRSRAAARIKAGETLAELRKSGLAALARAAGDAK